MNVKTLIKRLEKENKGLPVRMFAHDHDSEKHDEGTGDVSSVFQVTNDYGETFVALHA